MKTFFCKNFKFRLIIALCLLATAVIISCKKESNIEQGGQKLMCSEINECKNVIYSLHLDDNKDKSNYVDIANKKLVKDQDHWDFKMGGMYYASSINANTSLKGRLNFIDVEFDKVTAENILEKFGPEASFNNKFTNLTDFGMHHFLENEEGWANYNMDTHIVKPLTGRTILLIIADPTDNSKHKLFKIKILSMYQDCILNPTVADKKKVPYLTCRFEEIKINIDDLITD